MNSVYNPENNEIVVSLLSGTASPFTLMSITIELEDEEPPIECNCTCPGSGSNWEIDMSCSCNITSACNIGSGHLSFISTGTTFLNNTLTYNKSSTGGLGLASGMYLKLGPLAYLKPQ